MSTLEKFKWGNAFSYGDNNEISFTGYPLTQILGENGVGKSSIPLILEEVLYGKNSQGIPKGDIANRNLDKGYWGELYFSVFEDAYVLRVDRTKVLKVSLTKNGKDISGHTSTQTYKIVEELLGSFKLLPQLIYQSAESSLQFLSATDTKRKEFLVELFDQSSFNAYLLKSKEISLQMDKLKTSLESEIKGLALSLDSANKIKDSISTGEYIDGPNNPEIVDELNKRKGALEAQVAELTNYNKKVKENLEKMEATREIEDIQYLEEALSDLEALELPDKSSIIAEIGRRRGEKDSAINALKKLSAMPKDVCPTCTQKVDVSLTNALMDKESEALQKASHLEGRLEVTLNEINHRDARVTDLKKRIIKANNLIKIKDSIDTELLETRVAKDILLEISNINESIQAHRKEEKEVSEHNKRVSINNAKLETALQTSEESEKLLSVKRVEVEELYKLVEDLDIIKDAFGLRGIVAHKLESLVYNLEQHTNKYLVPWSAGRFSMRFRLSGDKLNVIILDYGHEVNLRSLSSGQRSRVHISTLLGIRAVVRIQSNIDCNLLFLDEVISFIDDAGKDQLAEMLLEEEALNIFMVSHSWENPLVNKILVEVDKDGLSKLTKQ